MKRDSKTEKITEWFWGFRQVFRKAQKVNWGIKSRPRFSALDLPHHLLLLKLIHMLTATKLFNSPLGGVTPSDPETLLRTLSSISPSPPLPARVPAAFNSQCSPGIVVFRSEPVALYPFLELRFPESLAAAGGRVT